MNATIELITTPHIIALALFTLALCIFLRMLALIVSGRKLSYRKANALCCVASAATILCALLVVVGALITHAKEVSL